MTPYAVRVLRLASPASRARRGPTPLYRAPTDPGAARAASRARAKAAMLQQQRLAAALRTIEELRREELARPATSVSICIMHQQRERYRVELHPVVVGRDQRGVAPARVSRDLENVSSRSEGPSLAPTSPRRRSSSRLRQAVRNRGFLAPKDRA